VITNAVVIDSRGIVKGDIGIRDGKIAGIGKAGNPDVMDGVAPDLVIGAATEVIAGEGLIASPGGIDTHIHLFVPSRLKRRCTAVLQPCSAEGRGRRTAPTPLPARPALLISTGCWRPLKASP